MRSTLNPYFKTLERWWIIEGIHERIQYERLEEEKENRSRAEEILERPPVWNEVQDLIMDDENSLTVDMRPEKRKREEISRGQRKRIYEEDLRGDKCEHSPTESGRVHPPRGFYSEEWDEELQDEDDYQAPDKFQRILRMVFPNGVSGDPPVKTTGVDVVNTT